MRAAAFLSVVVLAGIAGCDSGGIPGRQAVSGNVTLDGQPLPLGVIHFEPDGPGKVNASAPVRDGKYQIEANAGLTAGNYKVSIKSDRGPPPADPDEAMKQAQEAASAKEPIPEEYNEKTELRATVAESGPQVFDFSLKSK